MIANGLLENVARFKTGRSKRISSYDRLGGNSDRIFIGAGETVDIAHIRGAGIVKHIWMTLGHKDPLHHRNLLIRIYWDGAERPSVQSPLGDFFGQGWGESYPYVALPLCVSPVNAFNSYFPMPFRKSARIEIHNDSAFDCDALYYYVDYEERDTIDADLGYFHAEWRRRLSVPPEDCENEWSLLGPESKNLSDANNHVFVEATGRGHYVGMNYYVECPTPLWYGEGDDMFFIDGEPWPPSLHGTGTEDYFNSSYCPKVVYCHPYFGYPRVNDNVGWLGRTHCYRFHIEDPVIFHKSLRGSIECGHANSLTLDLITVAYWYQSEPHSSLVPLPDRKGRQNMPEISFTHIHRWREAWRQAQGGGKLWGDEPLPEKLVESMDKKKTGARKRMVPASNVKAASQAEKEEAKMLNRRKRKKA